jgi:hypothetical protein
MSGFGDSLTTVGTVQLHPLGTIVVEPATQSGTRANQGEKHWIYVGNNSGASIGINLACIRTIGAGSNSTYRVTVAPVGAAASAIVGFAQAEIPAANYGFLLRKGIGAVIADAAVLASRPLVIGAAVAGQVDDGAVTTAGVGTTLAASGAGTTVAYIDCKG